MGSGAVVFGSLADLDQAFANGAGGGLFETLSCGLGVLVFGIISEERAKAVVGSLEKRPGTYAILRRLLQG